MDQIRVPIDDLPTEFSSAVAAARAGGEVLLEEQGEVVARLVGTGACTNWEAVRRELEMLPPMDPSFSQTVLDAVTKNNRPVEDVSWAS